MRIIVLGCGVVGLSSGIRLLEAGHAVTIWAKELPPHTTSDVAAAIWFPYQAHPQDRVIGWARETFHVLQELSKRPGTGVTMLDGIELLHGPARAPWWDGSGPPWRPARQEEFPQGYANGFVFPAPLAEAPVYLRGYLVARFRALGGEILERSVTRLEEALADAPIVVNCTGLGARPLLGDGALYPIRGQVVRVSPIASRRFVFDDHHPDGLTYIIPRSSDCILGGTAQEDEWSMHPDQDTTDAILARCRDLVPELAGAQVLEPKVGLRPGRRSVRLEAEPRGAGLVVHNYGHGGSGYTLSWGCAREVVDCVERFQAGTC